jgi:hypothetical protein
MAKLTRSTGRCKQPTGASQSRPAPDGRPVAETSSRSGRQRTSPVPATSASPDDCSWPGPRVDHHQARPNGPLHPGTCSTSPLSPKGPKIDLIVLPRARASRPDGINHPPVKCKHDGTLHSVVVSDQHPASNRADPTTAGWSPTSARSKDLWRSVPVNEPREMLRADVVAAHGREPALPPSSGAMTCPPTMRCRPGRRMRRTTERMCGVST